MVDGELRYGGGWPAIRPSPQSPGRGLEHCARSFSLLFLANVFCLSASLDSQVCLEMSTPEPVYAHAPYKFHLLAGRAGTRL